MGVFTVRLVALVKVTFGEAVVPNSTVAPLWKSAPVSVSVVSPAVVPLSGVMVATVGAASFVTDWGAVVAVAATTVAVAGGTVGGVVGVAAAVAVGGTRVAVGGSEVAVGGIAFGVAVGGMGVAVDVAVGAIVGAIVGVGDATGGALVPVAGAAACATVPGAATKRRPARIAATSDSRVTRCPRAALFICSTRSRVCTSRRTPVLANCIPRPVAL